MFWRVKESKIVIIPADMAELAAVYKK